MQLVFLLACKYHDAFRIRRKLQTWFSQFATSRTAEFSLVRYQPFSRMPIFFATTTSKPDKIGSKAYSKLTVPSRFCYSSHAGRKDETEFMSEQEALRQKLAELELEHRDLDDVIARLTERAPYDQLQLQRLKKRKLTLKDQVSKVEAELLPDIIA